MRLQWRILVTTYSFKPRECTTPKAKLRVSCKLWMIMMCQVGSIATNGPLWWEMLIEREVLNVWGQGGFEEKSSLIKIQKGRFLLCFTSPPHPCTFPLHPLSAPLRPPCSTKAGLAIWKQFWWGTANCTHIPVSLFKPAEDVARLWRWHTVYSACRQCISICIC